MPFGPVVRRLAAQVAADPRTLSDAVLVRRFAADRDEAAFAALVERHGPTVLGVCRRALGHVEDAEDAAQAVFLVLARHARKLRKQASVGSWLHGVAVRVCRKARARRANRAAVVATPPPVAPADESVAWQDVRRVIDEALDALPESFRLPLILCYLHGLTRDEAAQQLGWSVTTLRGRLERGRERLRAELTRRGFPLSAALVAVLLSDSVVAASLDWVALVVRTATGPAPPPAPIESLTHGVVPVMNRWLLPTAALAVAGTLVAALVWANAADPPKPQPQAAPSKPLDALLKPDPKAKPVGDEFKGRWTASATAPDGNVRRDHALRWVDGSHLVWTTVQTGVGYKGEITIRYRYEIKDGTLTLHMLEKYAGEERMTLREDDQKPREYEFTWEGKGRGAFKLVSKANRDSPWATTAFTRADAQPDSPDPSVPESLRSIDRAIKKEPRYADQPLYLLLAFGPEAKFKVWVVLDGTTLHVDRNGNGDLTEAGESVPLGAVPGIEANPKAPAFLIAELADPAGPKHTDLFVSALRLNTGGVVAKLGVRVNGKTLQTAGPTDLRLTESPKDARVLHFGGAVVTARPSVTMPSTPDTSGPAEQRFQVGTPGVGPGSFASFASEDLPAEVSPVAEYEFAPAEPGGAAKKVTVPLTKRCCGDQFYGTLTVPDGVKTGLAAAKVTVSFPNCPWGKVEPATYTVDVVPKKK